MTNQKRAKELKVGMTAFWKLMQHFLSVIRRALICIAVMLVGFSGITACGSDNSALQLPEDFIRDFIARHETMIDKSLVYYYVKSEQHNVAEKINEAVRNRAAQGNLEALQKATFDFSGLQIELMDKKEEYINDEPVIFVKVAVTGNYSILLPEGPKKIGANEIIVLQMARNEWKVTETNNPWS